MKIKAAMVVALVGLAVGPAAAQSRWADEPGYAGGYVEGLPQRVIMRSVRMQGLMPVSRPMRRESVYVVEAVDEFERPRRVLVDARSARVVAVQPLGRAAPRPHAGEYAMRPPRGIPGGAGLPPRALPEDEFDDGRSAPQAGPPRLPPLRRPPLEQGALAPAPSPSLGVDAVPPPPPRVAPRSAAVNPAHPPAPRPRPATPEATGSTQPAAAAPSKPKGLPRVVLPGGPLPKAQRTAETRPGQRQHDDKPAAAKTPEPAATESGSAGIPPAQTLE